MFARLVSSELSAPAGRAPSSKVTLPPLGQVQTPSVDLTNEDLETTLADDDARHYGR